MLFSPCYTVSLIKTETNENTGSPTNTAKKVAWNKAKNVDELPKSGGSCHPPII